MKSNNKNSLNGLKLMSYKVSLKEQKQRRKKTNFHLMDVS